MPCTLDFSYSFLQLYGLLLLPVKCLNKNYILLFIKPLLSMVNYLNSSLTLLPLTNILTRQNYQNIRHTICL